MLRTRFLFLTLTLALGAFLAHAQDARTLDRLAPPSSLVALGISADAGMPQGLSDALEALDWAAAGEVVARLSQALAQASGELDATAGMLDPAAGLRDGLAAACPGAAEALGDVDATTFDRRALVADGLLTVSLTPYAPVPQVLALARPGDVDLASRLQDALIACFGGPVLDQDGVSLHVLGDGSDLPVVVARVNGVFVAGTDPEVVRGVVRRALGASEPSLADTRLGTARAALEVGGLDLAFDANAIADVLEGMSASLPAETNPVVVRLVASLRTLGAGAMAVGWDAQGLRLEQVLTVAEDAPDPALAALLTGGAAAPRPHWWPAGTVSAASMALPLRGWVEYLDGWLAELEPVTGMRADVRGLLADTFDVDLDALLLDWVGESLQTVQLEPRGTDLRAWVRGPATLTLLPVRDEAAARAAIADLAPALGRVVAGLGAAIPAGATAFPTDPFAGPGGGADLAALDAFVADATVAVETVTVAGIQAERLRIGPTLDVALAVVDGHLVMASPPAALAAVAGGATAAALDDPAWRAAADAVPASARAFEIHDAEAGLRGLADLAELTSQPLASGLLTALTLVPVSRDVTGGFGQEGDVSPPAWDPGILAGVELGPIDSIAPGTEVQSTLTEAQQYRAWDLVDVTPGHTIQIDMEDRSGGGVDTYLYLQLADSGDVIHENDDFDGTARSRVVFVAEPGVAYRVVASSWAQIGTGDFALSVVDRDAAAPPAAEPAPPAEPVAPPTFAEMLTVTDLLPAALHVLADHVGLAVGHTVVDGTTVRTVLLVPVR